MAAVLKPWITRTLLNHESGERITGNRNIQILQFTVYRTKENPRAPVQALISDQKTYILAVFDGKMTDRFEEALGRRLTECKGAILTIKAFKFVTSNFDGTYRLGLFIQDFKFLCGMGEPVIGQPIDLDEDSGVREWLERSVNALKVRKVNSTAGTPNREKEEVKGRLPSITPATPTATNTTIERTSGGHPSVYTSPIQEHGANHSSLSSASRSSVTRDHSHTPSPSKRKKSVPSKSPLKEQRQEKDQADPRNLSESRPWWRQGDINQLVKISLSQQDLCQINASWAKAPMMGSAHPASQQADGCSQKSIPRGQIISSQEPFGAVLQKENVPPPSMNSSTMMSSRAHRSAEAAMPDVLSATSHHSSQNIMKPEKTITKKEKGKPTKQTVFETDSEDEDQDTQNNVKAADSEDDRPLEWSPSPPPPERQQQNATTAKAAPKHRAKLHPTNTFDISQPGSPMGEAGHQSTMASQNSSPRRKRRRMSSTKAPSTSSKDEYGLDDEAFEKHYWDQAECYALQSSGSVQDISKEGNRTIHLADETSSERDRCSSLEGEVLVRATAESTFGGHRAVPPQDIESQMVPCSDGLEPLPASDLNPNSPWYQLEESIVRKAARFTFRKFAVLVQDLLDFREKGSEGR